MTARTRPSKDRRRRPPPVPCGPMAPAPVAPSRREALRFGLRDRAAAVLQDLRDLKQDAPGLITSAAALSYLDRAEYLMQSVVIHLEDPS
jgi:hypothetical protein